MKKVLETKHTERPKDPGMYSRLVCLSGDSKGRAYYLLGKRVVMGRSDKVDIRVLDIKSSREHAEITLVGKDNIITDLGSQNGVVVNDLKIKQHKLKAGDRIIIGRTIYKFENIFVDEIRKDDAEEIDVEEPQEESPSPEKKKKQIYMVVGAVLLLVMLFTGDDDPAVARKKIKKYELNEVGNDFARELNRKKASEDKKLKRKLDAIFQRGLREYREGNYFRALSEFDLALVLSPKDPLANYYKRKTKESLDGEVQKLFEKGRRDFNSLKYQGSIVAYCSIIRLLHNYPEDDRYKDAEANLREVEAALGMERDEIKCIEK